jgi:hypothetical protein
MDQHVYIMNLAGLLAWVDSQSAGVPWHSDERLARFALEDISSVIARHGRGQGLDWGDDWSIVLEQYTLEKMKEIAEESAKTHDKRRRR